MNDEQSQTRFDEGYEAAESAVFIEDNPYIIDTQEYQEWEDGWWSYFYSEEIEDQQ